MSAANEDLLKEVFGLAKKLGKVPFSTVVRLSSGHKVIPVDMTDDDDKQLVRTIQSLLAEFLRISRSSNPAFEGRRINDVGRKIEPQIKHELNRLPLEVELLPKAGYPDMKITFKGKVTYLEMKTTSTAGESRLRTFYYTDGKKITTDARHMLLMILASPVPDREGFWRIENITLSDLSNLSVKLKPEFNANKTDLMVEKDRLFSIT